MTTTTITFDRPVDLRGTLAVFSHGKGDPTTRWARDGFWRATRTPDGPATMCIAPRDGAVEVRVWGPGADTLRSRVPGWIGLEDDGEFHTDHPLLARLHRERPGLRIPKSRAVFEALVPTICGQKVTGVEARRAWRKIVTTFGEPAPGPADLLVAPEPRRLAEAGYYEFHPMGLEKKRADAIRRVASRAAALERLADVPVADAHAGMRAIPGIGIWSANEVAACALGDADAVSVGDFHLKNFVCFALAGEPRGTDERMLELLEPFRGQRGRVVKLIEASGLGAPRYGPRMATRNIERH